METLIPDFKGNMEQVQRIIDVAPEVVSHNMETVKRLTKSVRIQARYERSLDVLRYLKDSGMRSKTGIMLGLGETEEEVVASMSDLVDVGLDVLTLGQYLQPTHKHLSVKEFVSPEQFAKYKEIGLRLGIQYIESGPLVRSSYKAEKHLL
jgi:lipoic acid synthetase